jgi:hypothetical protein
MKGIKGTKNVKPKTLNLSKGFHLPLFNIPLSLIPYFLFFLSLTKIGTLLAIFP